MTVIKRLNAYQLVIFASTALFDLFVIIFSL